MEDGENQFHEDVSNDGKGRMVTLCRGTVVKSINRKKMIGGKDFSETKVPHGRGQLYQSVLPIIGACRKDRSQ